MSEEATATLEIADDLKKIGDQIADLTLKQAKDLSSTSRKRTVLKQPLVVVLWLWPVAVVLVKKRQWRRIPST